jgi:arylsulfatase A-like enzyme
MQGEASIALNALPVDVPTLPERLNELGYRCFGLAANINIGREIGFDRGFDKFKRIGDAKAEEMVDRVQEWLPEIEDGSEPWFLYLHFNDPHKPYVPHLPWYAGGAKSKLADSRARYRSELSYVDRQLARVHELLQLDQQGLLVIVSDHGEEFQEHGSVLHEKLYRTVTHVPFMLRLPGARTHGRIGTPVGLVDLMPTLLELNGIAIPKAVQGESLVPRIDRETIRHPSPVYSESPFFGVRRGVVLGDYHLLFTDADQSVELYNYRLDPDEQRDLASERPHDTSVMLTYMKEWRAKVESEALIRRDNGTPIDDRTKEQLRKLGYIQ